MEENPRIKVYSGHQVTGGEGFVVEFKTRIAGTDDGASMTELEHGIVILGYRRQ